MKKKHKEIDWNNIPEGVVKINNTEELNIAFNAIDKNKILGSYLTTYVSPDNKTRTSLLSILIGK